MAEYDSLKIGIEAGLKDTKQEVDSVNKSLDQTVKDLEKIENSKGLTPIADKSGIAKSALNETAQKMREVIEANKKFADVGRGVPLPKTLIECQKELKTLQGQIVTAEKAISRFQVDANKTSFERAVRNSIELRNRFAEVSQEIEKYTSHGDEIFTPQEMAVIDKAIGNNKKMIVEYKKELLDIKKLGKDAFDPTNFEGNFNLENVQNLFSTLKRDYPDALQLISQYEDVIREAVEYQDNISNELAKNNIKNQQQVVDSIRANSEKVKQAVNSIKMDMADWNTPSIGLSKEQAQQLVEKLREVESQSQSTQRGLGNAFSAIKDKVRDAGATVKQSIQNAMLNSANTGGIFKFRDDYVKSLDDIRDKIEQTKQEIDGYEKRTKFLESKPQNDGLTKTIEQNREAVKKLTEDLKTLESREKELSNMPKFTINFDNKNLKGLFSGVGKNVSKEFTQSIKKALDVVKRFAQQVARVLNPLNALKKGFIGFQSVLGNFHNSISRVTKMLRLMLIRSALRAGIDGMKEGFQNLTIYSDRTNASASMLMNSWNQLKNSLAAMVSPIFNAVAPALNALIQMLVKVSEAINQVLSSLFGRSTWTKAILGADSYRDSLDKTGKSAKNLKQQLQGIDELNVLTTDKDAGGGMDAGGLFKEEPIDERWQNIAKWLKEMWKDGDFTELGKFLGEKLKLMLDSIPWQKIKGTAAKIGKALATFINGIVGVEGLGESVGKTFAEIINTIFTSLRSFFAWLQGNKVGEFIADTLNGAFENIDWDTIKATFKNGTEDIVQIANSFLENFHWDNISDFVSNSINILSEALFDILSGVKWDEFGTNLGEQFRKTIEKIDWHMVGSAIGSAIQGLLDFVGNFIEQQDFSSIRKALEDFFKGVAENCDMGKVAAILIGALGLKLTASAGGAILAEVGRLLTQQIAKSMIAGLGSSSFLSYIGTFASGFGAAIITFIAGINIGKWIAEKISEGLGDAESADAYKNFSWKDFFDGFNIEDAKGAFKLWGEDIKLVFSTAGEKIEGFGDKASEKLGGFADKVRSMDFTETFGIFSGNLDNAKEATSNFAESVSEKLGGVTTFIGGVFKGDWEQAWNGIKEYFKSVWEDISQSAKAPINNVIAQINGLLGGIEKAINGIIQAVNNFTSNINSALSGLSEFTGKKIAINSIQTVSIPRIPMFASGGMPEDGLFMANHSELVGKFSNGKTAVANNEQIVSGISQGVENANAEQNRILERQTDLLEVIARKNFGITKNELFTSVQESAQRFTNMTGNPAF